MAENDLDDFFAKKDKSKKKQSAKLTPGDIMALQEEELRRGGKKDKKKKKEADSSNTRKENEEDNEWKQIEEEVKDFSGLRIHSLPTSNGDSRDDKFRDGYNDDDDDAKDGGQQGPWNKGKQASVVETPVEEVREVIKETPPVKEVKEATSTPSKYVPPALRQAQAQSAATSSNSSGAAASSKLRKKDAPNLRSEEDFPTLSFKGGADADQDYQSGVLYTTVGGRGKPGETPSQQRLQLQLGNKFTALDDNS